MMVDHLVLAGGGHTHAIVLLRWVMNPSSRPKGLITLINRSSTTIYSGMIPGVISDKYLIDEALINIRLLADRAGVSFVLAEITGIDLPQKKILLDKRPFPPGINFKAEFHNFGVLKIFIFCFILSIF